MRSFCPKTVFDVGMYDGEDTAYYLENGCKVVAVEANPELVRNAQQRFSKSIAKGELNCVNAAISPDGTDVTLHLCGTDLGSSTLFTDRISHIRTLGEVSVKGTTLSDLFKQYGVPDYLKVDIEGADGVCIRAITPTARPAFLSFEVGPDVDELLSHAYSVGYRRFKVINQISFREANNERCFFDWVAQRLMWRIGYSEPKEIRRSGRFFVSGHSSGPGPWESDGHWQSLEDVKATLARIRLAQGTAWYDIHASVV